MNVIVVTSGNYKFQQQYTSDGEVSEPSQAAYRRGDPAQAGHWGSGVWNRNARAWLRPMQLGPDQNPDIKASQSGENQAGLGAAQTLTLADADEIRKLDGVQYCSAGVHENVNAKVGEMTWFTRLHGDETSMPGIRRAWVFPHGRFFNAHEEKNGENVAVLGTIASQRLFGDKNPVGQTIAMRGENYEVVGVIASSTWMVPATQGDDQFDAIYIPITTAQRVLKRPYLDAITITTASTGDVTKVLKETKELLRQRHGITKTMPDDFIVSSRRGRHWARAECGRTL